MMYRALSLPRRWHERRVVVVSLCVANGAGGIRNLDFYPYIPAAFAFSPVNHPASGPLHTYVSTLWFGCPSMTTPGACRGNNSKSI